MNVQRSLMALYHYFFRNEPELIFEAISVLYKLTNTNHKLNLEYIKSLANEGRSVPDYFDVIEDDTSLLFKRKLNKNLDDPEEQISRF